VEDITKFGLKL